MKTTQVVIATSASATLLLAATPGIAANGWSKPAKAAGGWTSVAISANGKTNYAGWIDSGQLKVSMNGGTTKTLVSRADRLDPAIAASNTGAGILFADCKATSPKIGFVVTKDSGTTWSTPTTVAEEPCVQLQLKTSTDGQTLLAIWAAGDSPTVWRSSVSTDGGASWSAATDMPPIAFDPAIAMSSDGSRVVVVYERRIGGQDTVQVATSSDSGRSWQDPRNISPGSNSGLAFEDMDASADLKHVAVILQNSSARADQNLVSVSKNSGGSWSTPKAVGKKGDYANSVVAISDNGKHVASAWTSFTRKGAQAFVVSRSSNGGTKWGKPVTADGSSNTKQFPSFEMSGNGKRLIALWSGTRGIVAARNSGKKWTSTVLQSRKGSQLGPVLATSADGKRAIAGWQVGATSPKVYRSTAKL